MLRSIVGGVDGVAIRGVQFDSRDVGAGDLFVAVTGAERDGHDYCRAAVERGAAALIVERPLPEIGRAAARRRLVAQRPCARRRVAVPLPQPRPGRDRHHRHGRQDDDLVPGPGDARRVRLPGGSDHARSRPSAAASAKGYSGHTTPEAPIVQADLRAMADAGDRFAVVETTSHGLALERVAEVAYDVAVLTNITHEHLDLHGTYEAYVAAKRSLFSRLAVSDANPDKGYGKHAVINARDAEGASFAAAARAAGAQVLTYSVGDDVAADIIGHGRARPSRGSGAEGAHAALGGEVDARVWRAASTPTTRWPRSASARRWGSTRPRCAAASPACATSPAGCSRSTPASRSTCTSTSPTRRAPWPRRSPRWRPLPPRAVVASSRSSAHPGRATSPSGR